MRCFGRVRPVRHAGSVDIFLEALNEAEPGDVLVVDNGGRLDEACVGDLVALEVKMAGLAGILIWGLHRDTSEVSEIDLPLFSLGTSPTGPNKVDKRAQDALRSSRMGPWDVTGEDWAIADVDGILFVPHNMLKAVLEVGESIRAIEHQQASAVKNGTSLRVQTNFSEYLERRKGNPELGFREHLRSIGREIEV